MLSQPIAVEMKPSRMTPLEQGSQELVPNVPWTQPHMPFPSACSVFYVFTVINLRCDYNCVESGEFIQQIAGPGMLLEFLTWRLEGGFGKIKGKSGKN